VEGGRWKFILTINRFCSCKLATGHSLRLRHQRTLQLPLEDLIHGVIPAFSPGSPSVRNIAPGQIGLAFGSTCEGVIPGAALPHLYHPGAARDDDARSRVATNSPPQASPCLPWLCLDPLKSALYKKKFHVTSNLRYMHGVLNVDKIKN
jgi:hypothetical protein